MVVAVAATTAASTTTEFPAEKIAGADTEVVVVQAVPPVVVISPEVTLISE